MTVGCLGALGFLVFFRFSQWVFAGFCVSCFGFFWLVGFLIVQRLMTVGWFGDKATGPPN